MKDIFISYRRGDSQYPIWKLHRNLSDVFGEENVFLDVRDTGKGDDFREVQFEVIRKAKVVLAVIGDRWLTVIDDRTGWRRLDDPGDNVRREIETALEHKVRIIPVFLERVTGLRKEDLPASIQPLAAKNGHRIRPAADQQGDIEQLIDVLKAHVVAQRARPRRDSDIKNDIKNVITDHGVSSELLIDKPPHFFDCVRASRACYIPVSQKDHPVVSGFTFNHFFGPSTILSVTWPRAAAPVFLFYPRAGKRGEPANILRKGSSILFHGSYEINVTRTVSPMDVWLETSLRNPEAARDEFLRLPGGTLSKILDYKVKIPDLPADCRPFAVITRDLRKSEKHVYTQYVFQINLRLDRSPTANELRSLLRTFKTQHDNSVSALPDEATPDWLLTKSEDKKVMDYLALRGIRSNEPSLHYKTARFTRGFRIV